MGTPSPLFPKPAIPLWHSRHIVNTAGRYSNRGFTLPCGEWHASQPSTRTGGCS